MAKKNLRSSAEEDEANSIIRRNFRWSYIAAGAESNDNDVTNNHGRTKIFKVVK